MTDRITALRALLEKAEGLTGEITWPVDKYDTDRNIASVHEVLCETLRALISMEEDG